MPVSVITLYIMFCREHDKGPESFFKIMFQLDDLGLHFHLSVLGEQFSDVPGTVNKQVKRS